MNSKNNKPIPYKESLDQVNKFYLSTVQFLNKFSNYCDTKLLEVSNKLQRLETILYLLESKLSSIKGLDPNAPDEKTDDKKTDLPDLPDVNDSDGNNDNDVDDGELPPPPPMDDDDNELPAPNTSNDNLPPPQVFKVKDDPRLAPYYKLLKIGVRKVDIQSKFVSETGLDPSLLSLNPNDDSPLGAYVSDAPIPTQQENDDNENDEENDGNEAKSEKKVELPPPIEEMKDEKEKKEKKDDDESESEGESESGSGSDESEGESSESEGESDSESEEDSEGD